MNPTSDFCARPISGTGIGLRMPHVEKILETRPQIGWFEVLADNYLCDGGLSLKLLEELRQDYPIVMHSVGLSIGSTDPLDTAYLQRLKKFKTRFQPAWISEHLCWTSVHGQHFHDLLPLPYTQETVLHVAQRIRQVQDFFGERLLIENVSSYVNFAGAEMSEWEFVAQVAQTADCDLLLDVNNIHVSATNHDFDALDYLSGIPATRVKQLHLAGFEDHGDYLLDSHAQPVDEAVWRLYRQTLQRCGAVPTLIEWDAQIPPLERLLQEADKAQQILNQAPPTFAANLQL